MNRTLELFCGTKSFSKVMKKHGYITSTIDNDPEFEPTQCIDILSISVPKEQSQELFFIWASPPCTAFSVASIGKHWTGGYRAYIPKTKIAEIGLKLIDKTIEIITYSKPKYWCIENPRGVMRKVIDDIFKKYGMTDYRRVTVSYCQYGDTRMKPIDIWTNISNWNGKICKNRAKCYESAPRGSKTGTQGLKDAKERGVIPSALFEEILEHIQKK